PGTDTWITTKVKSELATTKDVKSMDISVKTVNGVVTLTGTQQSSDAVQKAVATARGIKGVKDVDATSLTVKQ
ncbi:MAG: BON domain-containing protein, partial [Gammaproteobacteria bacterium]